MGNKSERMDGQSIQKADAIIAKAIQDFDQAVEKLRELRKKGSYRDRDAHHRAPFPHHAAYGSVLRGSVDQARSDPGEQRPR